MFSLQDKITAAQYALKNGLSSQDLYIPDNRQHDFEALRACLMVEVQPVGQIQQDLFDQLLHAAWYLRIARAKAARAFEQDDLNAIDRWQRHINQYERSHQRALKMLRTLQTDRAIRQLPEHQHFENLPETVAPRPVIREILASAKRTHTQPFFAPVNGAQPAPAPPGAPHEPAMQ